jgi:hypothetical protein
LAKGDDVRKTRKLRESHAGIGYLAKRRKSRRREPAAC